MPLFVLPVPLPSNYVGPFLFYFFLWLHSPSSRFDALFRCFRVEGLDLLFFSPLLLLFAIHSLSVWYAILRTLSSSLVLWIAKELYHFKLELYPTY